MSEQAAPSVYDRTWYDDLLLTSRFLFGEQLSGHDLAAVRQVLAYLVAAEAADVSPRIGDDARLGWRDDRQEAGRKWARIRRVGRYTGEPALTEEELEQLDEPEY